MSNYIRGMNEFDDPEVRQDGAVKSAMFDAVGIDPTRQTSQSESVHPIRRQTYRHC